VHRLICRDSPERLCRKRLMRPCAAFSQHPFGGTMRECGVARFSSSELPVASGLLPADPATND
jgi:hypothetical protein